MFSTEISLKRSQYGGTHFHHMLIHLLPATNKNLFQPLESKWGNISNNRRLWEQSIKHMISPNRPYSQGLKCSFSTLVINTQIDQYLQSRVGYIYFFSFKTVRLLDSKLYREVFCFSKTSRSLDNISSKNRETFSLATWDVQIGTGGQMLGLWLSFHLIVTRPLQERKRHCGSA